MTTLSRSLGVVRPRRIGESLNQLMASPKRCAEMGQSGRQRIEEVLDWRVVSKQYRQLWHELNERRASARSRRWPAVADALHRRL